MLNMWRPERFNQNAFAWPIIEHTGIFSEFPRVDTRVQTVDDEIRSGTLKAFDSMKAIIAELDRQQS